MVAGLRLAAEGPLTPLASPVPVLAALEAARLIVGALLGAVLLGEPVTIFTILGGLLVVTGLAVAFGPGTTAVAGLPGNNQRAIATGPVAIAHNGVNNGL